MTDELEQIRARHEAYDYNNDAEWSRMEQGAFAHTDRATLLALLDAARAELAEERAQKKLIADAHDYRCKELAEVSGKLAEVREAAGPWLMWANDLDDDRPDDEPVSSLISAGEYRRLAAALKGSEG
jgi:hypothetical protein